MSLNSVKASYGSLILEAGALEIRDVEAGERPFLYASGNWGPGYVSVKGMVGQEDRLLILIEALAAKCFEEKVDCSFLAGNLSGGAVPGWQLSRHWGDFSTEDISFVTVGGTRRRAATSEYPLRFIDIPLLDRVSEALTDAVDSRSVSFVAGMVPDGMILGYEVAVWLEELREHIVPYVYIREAKKKGGQQEVITGIRNNPRIAPGCTGLVVGGVSDFVKSTSQGIHTLQEEGFSALDAAALLQEYDPALFEQLHGVERLYDPTDPCILMGSRGVVFEELVNFAETTCNSVLLLRSLGYVVDKAATILFYQNPRAVEALERNAVELIYLLTLPELLEVAEKQGRYSPQAVADYRNFLQDPLGWQKRRGLEPVVGGGTQ